MYLSKGKLSIHDTSLITLIINHPYSAIILIQTFRALWKPAGLLSYSASHHTMLFYF